MACGKTVELTEAELDMLRLLIQSVENEIQFWDEESAEAYRSVRNKLGEG